MKLIAIVMCLGLVPPLAGLAGCDDKDAKPVVVERPGEPDYVRVTDDHAMGRAIEKARQTQAMFAMALKKNDPSLRGFAVKKGFATPGGGLEHIWCVDPKWDGMQFTAVVNNEPVDTTLVKMGDRVIISPKELSDWMYVDRGILVGGYTVRVLHFIKPASEQKQFTEQTGITVPPIDF